MLAFDDRMHFSENLFGYFFCFFFLFLLLISQFALFFTCFGGIHFSAEVKNKGNKRKKVKRKKKKLINTKNNSKNNNNNKKPKRN